MKNAPFGAVRRMSECRNRGTRIPDHHGIAFKPEIAGRQTFGHWEGDLMIFNREHGSTNLTSLIERKIRYTMLAKNTDRRPSLVVGQIGNMFAQLPRQVTQTLTFDRGFEFMSYPVLQKTIGMESYFCDPQAPWQRKAVSRATINRIRRFLPRETNLAALDAADKLKEHWSPEQISFFSGALPVCTVYVAAKQTGDI